MRFSSSAPILTACCHCRCQADLMQYSTFFLSVHQELPVNVKFVIEGMEETGSNGLDAMILAQRDTFFSNVDYIIISDCGWLSRRPALTYGTRGNCYFYAEVLCAHTHRNKKTERFGFK